MADKSKKKGGLSFRSDDAIETGLFASGPATIKDAEFALFDYGGNAKPTPVLLVTFMREGEENYEQPYSIGRGWKVKDGVLVPLNGQSGLPKNCNAMQYLIKPLEKALEAADAPDDFMDEFPGNLADLEVVVSREAQVKRDIKEKGKGKEKADDKERTILVVEEITEAPWMGKSKSKSKAKGKAKDDDDDDDAKGKSKGRASKDDDEDEGDDEVKEEGIEAMVTALEKNDGKLAEDDLADALTAVLKKNKNAKAIVKYMTSDDGLELEKGWSYNSKKGLIIAD